MSQGPRAVFFDLFNTLLHFDMSGLPMVVSGGEPYRTTSLQVYRDVGEHLHPPVSYEDFLEAVIESRNRAVELRGPELREVPCRERFRILCRLLGIDESFVPRLVAAHMDAMFSTMYCPAQTPEVLDRLRGTPLILVSNFDHAATARRALRHFDLESRFQAIFISEEVGWRKPGRRLFEAVLGQTGFPPSHSLWVGDDPRADVEGPAAAGFRVAWLADSDQTPAVEPDWTIRDLREVVPIVGAFSSR